jgi:hypothetical protein
MAQGAATEVIVYVVAFVILIETDTVVDSSRVKRFSRLGRGHFKRKLLPL